MIRFSIRKLLAIAAVVCVILGGARLYFSRLEPVIPSSMLEHLQPGMTKYEVQAILGSPANRMESNRWVYERASHPGWLGIHFDKDGRLERIDNSRAVR